MSVNWWLMLYLSSSGLDLRDGGQVFPQPSTHSSLLIQHSVPSIPLHLLFTLILAFPCFFFLLGFILLASPFSLSWRSSVFQLISELCWPSLIFSAIQTCLHVEVYGLLFSPRMFKDSLLLKRKKNSNKPFCILHNKLQEFLSQSMLYYNLYNNYNFNKKILVVFLLIPELLVKQHTFMHRPNIGPFTSQSVNNTNKRKLVSFDCVFSALPVKRAKKTNL